jgi:serine/threonine-protein kinase RsbT
VRTGHSASEMCLPVQAGDDVVAARRKGRAFADLLGFESVEATIVATVISELARQILRDTGRGEIVVAAADDTGRRGVVITVRHGGHGIVGRPAGLAQRLLDVGMAGCWRWLNGLTCDELEIVSDVGKGTIVTVKWKA